MEQQAILAIGIFLVTYGMIIAEKIHRTIVAMLGGVLMVVLGIVDQESALHLLLKKRKAIRSVF